MNVAAAYTYLKTDTECRNLPFICDSTLERADQCRLGATIRVELADGQFITISESFITDFFSVPPWLHTLFKPYDNRTNLAALVHDYLYECWEQTGIISDDPRKYADDAMLEIAFRYRRNGTLKAYYYAVRLGGAGKWRYYRDLAKPNPVGIDRPIPEEPKEI